MDQIRQRMYSGFNWTFTNTISYNFDLNDEHNFTILAGMESIKAQTNLSVEGYNRETLFNDPEYGGDKIIRGTTFTRYKQFVQNCFGLLPGQALHAKTLGFVHPSSQKEMLFEAPLPDGLSEVLNKWRTYIQGRREE